jgi:hypothetical protein
MKNDQELYIVKYTGPLGFIKPWTAVRDAETYSQQFLTPSILAGIERKLFPEFLGVPFGIFKIKGYRLSYSGLSMQQEQTQPRGWNKNKNDLTRSYSILTRGVMLDPILYLAFSSPEDAQVAAEQHICLCRNEDLLLPDEQIQIISKEEFDEPPYEGFELIFEENEHSFLVGYNRLDNAKPMYGWLKIVGNPVKIDQA